jgi:two-component system sensor histidine kinase VicK
VGAIKIFRDVTQEKEIDRSKSEFVSVASHQLKTPATIVNFYTEKLLNSSHSVITAKQRDYINEIRDANQRMIEIVNTLLNVSRIEMGIFPIDPMPVDVIGIFKNTIKESQMNLGKKKLILKEKYHRLKHMIPIDALMLKMIFSNLLSNAIKYTSAGDSISIETSEKNDDLLVSIADNGCGIPANQQDKIFTKFFRSDNARRHDTDGTGLGLYIVKLMLDHIGGKVWFSSKEKEGTSFYFSIPLNNLKS